MNNYITNNLIVINCYFISISISTKSKEMLFLISFAILKDKNSGKDWTRTKLATPTNCGKLKRKAVHLVFCAMEKTGGSKIYRGKYRVMKSIYWSRNVRIEGQLTAMLGTCIRKAATLLRLLHNERFPLPYKCVSQQKQIWLAMTTYYVKLELKKYLVEFEEVHQNKTI